ncbi:MAG: hypothetical protein K2H29_05240 [Oscillospiraceae bacterium]|nr:hypothetical protein [Oscillospiraceae bacterium]MDE6087517.1 hypothetical protein [Oscillospiraceae bacterium]
MIRKNAIFPAVGMALALTGCGMNKTDDHDRAVRITEPDYPAETVRATEPKRYNHGNYDPENNDETNEFGDAVNDAVGDVMDDAGDVVSDVADGAGDVVSDVADGARDVVSDVADAGRDLKDDAERHD